MASYYLTVWWHRNKKRHQNLAALPVFASCSWRASSVIYSLIALWCAVVIFFVFLLAVVWRVWPEIAGWNCDTVVLWRQNCCGFCFCLRAEAFCVFRPFVCPSVRPPVLHILAPFKHTPIENPFYWHKYLLGHKLIRIRRSAVKTFLSVYWEISTQTADFTDLGFCWASAWRGSLQQCLV